MKKQYRLLRTIILFHETALKALDEGKSLQKILDLPVRQKIARARFIPEDRLGDFDGIEAEIRTGMPK